MSTIIMSQCWMLKMTPAQKAVLISLADNANDHGHCWPSIPTICERTCLSRRAVINAISELEKSGALYADRTNGRHTKYVVTPGGYTGEITASRKENGRGLEAWKRRQKAAPEPAHDVHPCTTCTGAPDAPDPCTTCTGPVHQVHPNRKEPSRTVKSSAQARRTQSVQFPTWMQSLTDGEDAIPETDPVFRYAADVGIPDSLLELAWAWFERTYSGPRKSKRYTDWRQVFRNAVEGNWAKAWRFTPDGECVLTSEGEMLRRAVQAESKRTAA